MLLSPTIARTSLPLGTVRMDGTAEQYRAGRWRRWSPFTAVCNATGVPAMSVPMEWTDDGLPIGMHFVGRFGAEEMLYLAGGATRTSPPVARPQARLREHSHEQLDAHYRRRLRRRRRKRAGVPSVRHSGIATELGWARSQIYNMRPVPPFGRADHHLGRPSGEACGASWPRSSCRACRAARRRAGLGAVRRHHRHAGQLVRRAADQGRAAWAAASACPASWSCRSSRGSGGFGMWLIARWTRAALSWH